MVVADGDEADVVRREDVVRVLSDLDVVPSEAAHVLDDDDVDPPALRIFEHPLYAGAVEIRAAVPVVDVLVHDLEAILTGVFLYNEFLILDGQRLAGPLVLL